MANKTISDIFTDAPAAMPLPLSALFEVDLAGSPGGSYAAMWGDLMDDIRRSIVHAIPVAVGDETTAITTGTAKVTFRNPYNKSFTLTGVKASLTTAQASGSIFTVDVNEGGVSLLSTKITIDNTELTSVTASTPPVIDGTGLVNTIAPDGVITVDVDQVGDGTAAGLKVALIGYLT